MIELTFSSTDQDVLRDQRFGHPHPHVQRKMEALLLKSFDLPHHHIAAIVGVCPNTLRTYFHEYQAGGVARLQRRPCSALPSALAAARDTLVTSFRRTPPATLKEAGARIAHLTGLTRHRTQVRHWWHALGMKRRKTGSIPAKADPDQQRRFKVQQLEPRLQEARQGTRCVYFVDAAHFVLAPFLGFLWCFTRCVVKAPCGRQRFNVLGALQAVTHELLTVTHDTYINAQSVCSLLRQIAQQQLAVPITLVLDNATYQRCALVQTLAASLHIELLYLPAYSPNLNLIERFWKLVKKECLASTYYPNFLAFRNALERFIHDAPVTHTSQLNALLTHQFQEFDPTTLTVLAA